MTERPSSASPRLCEKLPFRVSEESLAERKSLSQRRQGAAKKKRNALARSAPNETVQVPFAARLLLRFFLLLVLFLQLI